MKNSRKKILFIIPAVLSLIALGGCSGVIGGGTSLRMYIPNPAGDSGVSGGRYIDPSASVADVLVAQQDKAYSYNNFDTVAAGTSYYVSNLFPDTYIIGVALRDSIDNLVNLKLLEYDMKPGLNNIPLILGPGIDDLYVNDIEISNPFQPEGYTARFGTNTIIIGGLRTGGNDIIDFESSVDSETAEKIISDGTLVVTGSSDSNFNGINDWTISSTDQGLKFTIFYNDLNPDTNDFYDLFILLE